MSCLGSDHIVRTDLAVEALDLDKNLPEKGIKKTITAIGNIEITKIEILNTSISKKMGKPIGTYITCEINNFLFCCDDLEEEITGFSSYISNLLPKTGAILVAGIGNLGITPDSLGPLSAQNIFATGHIPDDLTKSCGIGKLREVYVISPGVLGKTGFEASDVIISILKNKSFSGVIAIDALAAKSIDRLGCTVQLTNSGISPGSGVENARKEISFETLGIPTISIGMPTVVDCTTLCLEIANISEEKAETYSHRSKNMMVTPRDIDVLVEKGAKFIAMAINKAMHPQLSIEELSCLI